MKVLFIGGTGIISSASSALAVERGIELYHLNRGKTANLRAVDGVRQLTADINNPEEVRAVLAGQHFDAVVDWIVFTPDQIRRDIGLFSGITAQYIFISSASAYQTPPLSWPTTEETPLDNPFWEYSRNKIACEQILLEAYRNQGFPGVIVRPSHTYDKTLIPLEGGYTQLARMKQGKPAVLHGDGSSLWTLTHHRDFAKGLVGMLGMGETLGQAYHITSDEYLSWERIFTILAEKMGIEPKFARIPSQVIARYHKDVGDSLLGDKAHSMIFDNSKIKKLIPDFVCTIPFSTGAEEIAGFYASHPEFQKVDESLDRIFDRICADYSF